MEVSIHIVSCSVCKNIAMIGVDGDDNLYFLCLVCNRVTPFDYIQEEIKAGNKLKRMRPDQN